MAFPLNEVYHMTALDASVQQLITAYEEDRVTNGFYELAQKLSPEFKSKKLTTGNTLLDFMFAHNVFSKSVENELGLFRMESETHHKNHFLLVYDHEDQDAQYATSVRTRLQFGTLVDEVQFDINNGKIVFPTNFYAQYYTGKNLRWDSFEGHITIPLRKMVYYRNPIILQPGETNHRKKYSSSTQFSESINAYFGTEEIDTLFSTRLPIWISLMQSKPSRKRTISILSSNYSIWRAVQQIMSVVVL